MPRPEEVVAPTIAIPVRAGATDVLQSFIASIMLGYNPLLATLTLVSLALGLKRLISKKGSFLDGLVVYNVAIGLVGTLVSVAYIVSSLHLALIYWTGTVVRMAHTSLPGIAGLRFLYERIKPRHFMSMFLILLVASGIFAPAYATVLQRSLSLGASVDRLSFDYRAPYYRLYLMAKDSGNTLVIGGYHMRGVWVYMSMLPNVVLVGVPGSEEAFKDLIGKGWDSIFLYDDWYTIRPEFLGAYPPYYRQILVNATYYEGFRVVRLWVDAESYCIQLVKV